MDSNSMREISKTIDRIKSNDKSAYAKDGTNYQNSHKVNPNSERLNTSNTYKEWTVKTPNIGGRGQRRIVINNQTKQAYYTHDHYNSFIEIDLKGW
ncbi:ribonuclease domain-containing protein [Tenacibaculum dicentrarchi]|uniref:ribonuclease domain-containing protein n=1 Tax=Tenacibaculum dicentrarchi TaxID=669041 RepID=UPI003518E2BD